MMEVDIQTTRQREGRDSLPFTLRETTQNSTSSPAKLTSSKAPTNVPFPLPCCGGPGGPGARPRLSALSAKVFCAVLHRPPLPALASPGPSSQPPCQGPLAQGPPAQSPAQDSAQDSAQGSDHGSDHGSDQDSAKDSVQGPVQGPAQGPPAQGTPAQSPTAQDPAQGPSTRSLVQLHSELQSLRGDLDHMKSQHNKEIKLLMNELDEEKRVRLTLQMEVQRMKKQMSKLLDRK